MVGGIDSPVIEAIGNELEEKSFAKYDCLGLESLADQYEKFILSQYKHVNGSYVFSVHGKFGAGKSDFCDMWLYKLRSDGYLVCKVDTWESDHSGDPSVSIVYELTRYLTDNNEEKENDEIVKNLKKAALGFAGSLISQAVSGLISKFTRGWLNIDICKAAIDGREFADKTMSEGNEVFAQLEQAQNSIVDLNEALEKLVKQNKYKPIFIFIDELDRCDPVYAVRYLESLKHFFKCKGIIFILTVNVEQLECSAKKLFGAQLDFQEYYRKFVHCQVWLNTLNKELVSNYISKKMSKFKEESAKYSIEMDHKVEYISHLIFVLNFTPRQIDQLFANLMYFISVDSDKNHSDETNWINKTNGITAIFIVCILDLHDHKIVVDIAVGKYDFMGLLTIFDISNSKLASVLAPVILHVFSSNTSFDSNKEKIESYFTSRNMVFDSGGLVNKPNSLNYGDDPIIVKIAKAKIELGRVFEIPVLNLPESLL